MNVYDINKQLYPSQKGQTFLPLELSHPKLIQAQLVLTENSNYIECKNMCLRNRECLVYITPEVKHALRDIPESYIDSIVNDGTHRGIRRYAIDGHEFWVFKKYDATLLRENLLSYDVFTPYLYTTKKYNKWFFAKRGALIVILLFIFVLSLLCSVVLVSELLSWIAAGICMFVAGFNSLYIIKLYRKSKRNPSITHCDIDRLLLTEHSIPHVAIVVDDTSEII